MNRLANKQFNKKFELTNGWLGVCNPKLSNKALYDPETNENVFNVIYDAIKELYKEGFRGNINASEIKFSGRIGELGCRLS